MSMKKYLFFILVCASALCLPSLTKAAGLSLKLDEALLKNEGRAVISVYLDSSDKAINALGGELAIASGTAVFSDIQDGDSIVSAWVERPEVKNNKIAFAGIIPGGFSGMYTPFSKERQPGLIMKIALTSEAKGDVVVALQNPQIFSGAAEAESVSVSPQALKISFEKRTSSPEIKGPLDTTAPMNLSIDIMKLGEGSEGWFAAFSADDFQSGIDHFEIQESRINQSSDANWIRASSPARLRDQMRNSYVFIKAVDRQGNQTIHVVEPTSDLWHSFWPWIVGGIFILVTAAVIVARRRI